MRFAAVSILVTGCFVSPPIHFGEGKSAKESQHEQMAKETPHELEAPREARGDTHVEKIRVWADDDYRAQNLHWEHTFGDQLAYANEVLGPMLGIQLEAEYHVWQHRNPGAALEEVLAELAKQDPGDGVFTVIGLTSALPLVTATLDHIGMASTPGRHLVLRGYADIEERAAFEQEFRDLKTDERQRMYEARRRHKGAAVLLHELGHNLGAPHELDPDTIMNGTYSPRSVAFNAHSREVMHATLDGRRHGTEATAVPRAPEVKHPTLSIAIDASGQTLVGGKPVDDETLDELFKLSFTDDPDTEVVVRAAPGTPQAAVIKILEHAKAAGLRRMAIGTGG